jgi:hypothetical protein
MQSVPESNVTYSSDALYDVVTEEHMIAFTIFEGLVIEGFFLLAVVVSLGDSIRDWTDHVSIAPVFHP